MREVALEVRRVGQHAEAAGAMLLVGPRDGDRVEVGPDDLGRGTGLLDLGDEPDRAGAGQRRAEVADRRSTTTRCFELLERQPPPRGSHFDPVLKPRSHPGWSSSWHVSIRSTIRS